MPCLLVIGESSICCLEIDEDYKECSLIYSISYAQLSSDPKLHANDVVVENPFAQEQVSSISLHVRGLVRVLRSEGPQKICSLALLIVDEDEYKVKIVRVNAQNGQADVEVV